MAKRKVNPEKRKNKKRKRIKQLQMQKKKNREVDSAEETGEDDDIKDESDFEEVSEETSTSFGGPGGFPTNDDGEEEEDEARNTRKMVQQQNRKKKKSGGFQSMGLSHPVFKGVIRKGYKVPTPIQRKTIPVILDGKDVVAMARTGSGKTAAFLIPMFEKLKTHSAQSGARALILSPTRELALQTLKFAKELGRFTGLRSAVVLGGDRMEDQFAALHENPDIIIATPGRFMHVLVEMDMKLGEVQYVVFDEADRLFEMGFQEQLHEIVQRLPDSRQTLLFSATLPKLLVEFARAGLHDPTLIRLDVDTKLSENLKLSFVQCRNEDKLAVLLYMLRSVLKPSEQTVIFAATKHHVEFLYMILTEAGISCSYTYSSLDQTARKINVAKFRNKKTMVLLVTDIAARGIDIPMLDNVINYHFPAKPKLFVHRVGRVARAGRSGTAFSLVDYDEVPYVIDLHLFLGRPMKIAQLGKENPDSDGMYGRVPQVVIDEEEDNIRQWQTKSDIEAMVKVTWNAMKHYVRSRPAASSESIYRAKEITATNIAVHPVFGDHAGHSNDDARNKLLSSMRSYKPNHTIFEINSTKKKDGFDVMKKKRYLHGNVIQSAMKKREDSLQDLSSVENHTSEIKTQELSTQADIEQTFSTVVAPRPQTFFASQPKQKGKKKAPSVRDEENYLHYRPKDYDTEKGLSLGSSFEQEVASAMMDLTGDEESMMRQQRSQMQWDRKQKIKTESGQWISATFKQDLYKNWLEKSKAAQQEDEEMDSEEESKTKPQQKHRKHGFQAYGVTRRGKGFYKNKPEKDEKQQNFEKSKKGSKFSGKGPKRELKRREEILKERRKKAIAQGRQKFRQQKGNKKQKFGKK